ncbi:hypothetical protein LTS08_008064 [Lithohypha guttulata]|nr:hypothetical protein LTS08_008064 [Lithohypha guttulata]
MSFSKIVFAVSAFAALSAAIPLNIPRDVTSVVTETSYTTVDVPVTLWVDENGKPIKTEAQGVNFAEQTKSLELTAAQVVPTTTPAPPAQPTTTTSTSTSTQAPAVAPTTTIASSAYQAPTPVTPSSSSSPVASASAAPATNKASSGQVTASDSASCEGTGNACVGDITHWDGGLGACGWNVDSNSEFQIALPHAFMGTQSNGNPYCGRSLTVLNPQTGVTIQATVGDKCMGCVGRSIDLTNALFAAVGNGCDGRCSGFQWWFN